MNLVSDDFRICSPSLITVWPIVNIGENILEPSETNFMNSPPYVFDVDYVARIRSELSITVLDKILNKIIA